MAEIGNDLPAGESDVPGIPHRVTNLSQDEESRPPRGAGPDGESAQVQRGPVHRAGAVRRVSGRPAQETVRARGYALLRAECVAFGDVARESLPRSVPALPLATQLTRRRLCMVRVCADPPHPPRSRSTHLSIDAVSPATSPPSSTPTRSRRTRTGRACCRPTPRCTRTSRASSRRTGCART